MANYTSTIPVLFTEATDSSGYVLLLESDAAAASPPQMNPRDEVTATTTASSVQCTVDSSNGAPEVTGVTAIPIGSAPSVSFTGSAGVYTATFPATLTTDYSWRIEVTIDAEPRFGKRIVLDPILIIRKTN
ncbi:hypothetical protein SAMN02745121_06422 [Nannocystis exedens]|uniref:Uncharacterized protein n=1 Tax=Nannocystis exedens TaxID=54 RepID=A0A1I2F2I2_9BACT|nr:hypothetical protein [Nannocystis exedens]PCC69613.1 hypothetical protein NAEX_02637 [Nannocystis exedens]SFE99183.1 hypothetical protein SAMN02745121_06422 [Nannocystis exedens]